MTEERKPPPARPVPPPGRGLKAPAEPRPCREEVVEREAAKLADKVNANA